MILKIAFHILAIIMAIFIVIEEEHLQMVIGFSIFSLFVSAIYFFNYAPDVAIAEIAIGSAIVPIMLLISISKQRNFIVAGDIESDEFSEEGNCYQLLDDFCELYGLDLKIIKDLDQNELVLSGVFRVVNVDLYVKKREGLGGFFLIGKESSVLMRRLEMMTRGNTDVMVILAPDLDSLGGDLS
jgi:putative multicomponent Na+:H+ antiporter subunit B